MASAADAYVGEVLNGRFRLEKHIGDGYFSHVFEAADLATHRSIAVKLLQPSAATSAEDVVEFEMEARLLQILSPCPNVVDLIETDSALLTVTINNVPGQILVRYHALELADGALDDILMYRHELEWQLRLSIFRQLVAGTHQMHMKDAVHRDSKASNALMFKTDTRNPVVKLSDLGRSCLVHESPRFPVTTYIRGRGDMSFAPPEMLWLQGDADSVAYRRTDIYLLGSMLFEIATGQGLTGIAIPDWQREVRRAVAVPEKLRASAFRAAIPGIRVNYELPFKLLAAELPPSIRSDGVNLVRQMCEPDPAMRERRFKAERKNPQWGLDWVFRRVDIMMRNLHINESRAKRTRKRAAGS